CAGEHAQKKRTGGARPPCLYHAAYAVPSGLEGDTPEAEPQRTNFARSRATRREITENGKVTQAASSRSLPVKPHAPTVSMANSRSSGNWQLKQPVAMALPVVILKA